MRFLEMLAVDMVSSYVRGARYGKGGASAVPVVFAVDANKRREPEVGAKRLEAFVPPATEQRANAVCIRTGAEGRGGTRRWGRAGRGVRLERWRSSTKTRSGSVA